MSGRCVACSPRCADDYAAGWYACVVGVRPDRYAQRHGWTCDVGPTGAEGEPFDGALFAFRGRRGGMVKLLWYDGQGMCLFSKRLERGHFVWPVTETGRVSLTPAQLSMLLEGIDWRVPVRPRRPELAG